jgi:hypothetical protein
MLKVKDFKTNISYNPDDKIKTESSIIKLETFKQEFCITIVEKSSMVNENLSGFIDNNIRYDTLCMVTVNNITYNTKTTFKMQTMHIGECEELNYLTLILNLILAKSNLLGTSSEGVLI